MLSIRLSVPFVYAELKPDQTVTGTFFYYSFFYLLFFLSFYIPAVIDWSFHPFSSSQVTYFHSFSLLLLAVIPSLFLIFPFFYSLFLQFLPVPSYLLLLPVTSFPTLSIPFLIDCFFLPFILYSSFTDCSFLPSSIPIVTHCSFLPFYISSCYGRLPVFLFLAFFSVPPSCLPLTVPPILSLQREILGWPIGIIFQSLRLTASVRNLSEEFSAAKDKQ